MACLASDVDVGPARGKGVGRRIVVLAQVGRMTGRAHVVPVLAARRPVQGIAGLDAFPGIKVVPALAALRPGARVPDDRERLQAFPRQFDQVLLQGMDPEGEFDLEIGEMAVGAVRIDEEPVVASEESRCDPAVGEADAAEIAEYRLFLGFLHCQCVMRAAPLLGLPRVAFGAGGGADMLRNSASISRLGESAGREAERRDDGNQHGRQYRRAPAGATEDIGIHRPSIAEKNARPALRVPTARRWRRAYLAALGLDAASSFKSS